MIGSNDFQVELCTILQAPVVLRLLQNDECRRGWRDLGVGACLNGLGPIFANVCASLSHADAVCGRRNVLDLACLTIMRRQDRYPCLFFVWFVLPQCSYLFLFLSSSLLLLLQKCYPCWCCFRCCFRIMTRWGLVAHQALRSAMTGSRNFGSLGGTAELMAMGHGSKMKLIQLKLFQTLWM